MKKHKFIFAAVLIVGIVFFVFSCKKETPKVVPTVTASAVTNITANSASAGGTVTADGGAPVTARGVCWSSTNITPTASDSKTSEGTGTGSFPSSISELAHETTYYIRAYATNSVGTGYSSASSFKTLAPTTNIIPIIGVYYWPHWGDNSQDAAMRLRWSEKVFTPLIGEYDASDITINEQQIETAYKHNISLFILSAYEKRIENFLGCSNINKISVALNVDLTDKGGFRDPGNFGNVLDWVYRLAINNKPYFKIEDRPVIFIGEYNLLRNIYSFDYIKKGFEDGRKQFLEKYGLNIFIIGVWNSGGFDVADKSMPIVTSTEQELSSIVDGVTIYNFPTIGTNGVIIGNKYENTGTYENFVTYLPDALSLFQKGTISNSTQVFIPSTMPGFNNSTLYNHGLDNWLVNRIGPSPILFYQSLQSLSKFLNTKYPMILLDAWNEYSEGSVIEPTIESGYTYIEQIKKYTDSF